MGKTRLAAEALEDRRRASIELSARAHPLGDTASFGLWVEALERHLRTLAKHDVAVLCGGFLDDLASLLRSVAVVRGAAPDREPPRPRLLEGLAVLLANLAEQAPVVVVLDDVHLADASSWDALHYLAGSLSTERILVVASARPGELAEHTVAQRVLLDLEQVGALHRVDIGPLPTDAVRELAEEVIGAAAEPELIDWLGSRAQGNPLFVLGLLQALVEEGADLSRPALRSLPEGLAERVRVRMDRLDDSQRSVMEVLAVAGGRVELGDVVVLCDRPLEELGPSLQALVRSRFVAEAPRGRTFSYEISHPLIQETVYEGIVGARRVVLHRQVGRVLLTMGRLGEAAPHFARSADVGDAEALAVLSDALHQAEERGVYGEALRILGRPGRAPPGRRPALGRGGRRLRRAGRVGLRPPGRRRLLGRHRRPAGHRRPPRGQRRPPPAGQHQVPPAPASWPGGRASSTRPPPPPPRPSTSSPGPATAPACCWPPSRSPT